MEGIASLFGGRLLRLVPPVGQALAVGLVEEQGIAEQAFDRFLDLRLQRIDDRAEPGALARLLFQRFQIVADRLFARDRR
jgi:hypothetical protein